MKKRLDRGEKFILVDVREESEFAKDHFPARSIWARALSSATLRLACPIWSGDCAVCGGGFRSALAADNLQKMGYTNVISMDGGIRDWREKGYPLTKG